jgi:hypothetical protein
LIDAYGETRSGVRRDNSHRQAKPGKNKELARSEAALAASFGTISTKASEARQVEETKHRKINKLQKKTKPTNYILTRSIGERVKNAPAPRQLLLEKNTHRGFAPQILGRVGVGTPI